MATYRDFVALLTASRHARAERSRIPRPRRFDAAYNADIKRRLALYLMPTVIIETVLGERQAFLDPTGPFFVVESEQGRDVWPLEDVRSFRPTEVSAKSLRIQAEVNEGRAARAAQADHTGAQG